jgi:hypothetical protein
MKEECCLIGEVVSELTVGGFGYIEKGHAVDVILIDE